MGPIHYSTLCSMYYPDPETNHCVHYIMPDADPIGLCKEQGKFQCIIDIHIGKPSLSHSSRYQFVHCRQKYYFDKIKGIRCKPEHLPRPMASGAIWDKFQTSIYKGTSFKDEFKELCIKYDMSVDAKARLVALFRAWKEMEIKIDTQDCKFQKEFYLLEDEYLIHGFIDRAYSSIPAHIVECKLGSQPSRYHSIMTMTSQLSTYFLSSDTYEYCIVEAVKLPQLRFNGNRENPEQYTNRCYDHIISNVQQYFPGWDNDKGMFGKKFYRNEFPLVQIKQDYIQINKDIKRCVKGESNFYQNFLACHVPTDCEYLPMCTTGVMSDEIYYYKPKEVKKE